MSLKYIANPRNTVDEEVAFARGLHGRATVAAVSTFVATSSGETVHFLSPLVSVIRFFWASSTRRSRAAFASLGVMPPSCTPDTVTPAWTLPW